MNPSRSNDDDVKEVSLAATAGKLRGICRNCKMPGHMARDCRVKKDSSSKDEEQNYINLRPCRHCGGKHLDHRCWELPQNAEYRPRNWKTKMGLETANVPCDHEADPRIELLLSSVDETSLQQNVHLKSNIWIADTAATMHMTPYEDGMMNKKMMNSIITIGNGEQMRANMVGDIPCVICDKYGNSLNTGMLTEVTVTKNSPYNLFSLTKDDDARLHTWRNGVDGHISTEGRQVTDFCYSNQNNQGSCICNVHKSNQSSISNRV
jgi:hypothetical protein